MSYTPRTIPLNDGRRIPWLGFGTGTALLRQDAAEQVRNAIEHGIVHLDGAQLYGNEDSLGAGIAAAGRPRAELFVTTKIADLPDGKTVRETLVESLAKLRLDYVDLFLLHSPQRLAGKVKAAWLELEQLQKEGLTRSIGVSNFRTQDLEEVLEVGSVVPAVNQIEYHPYVFKATQPVLEFMRKHDILATSYCGLVPLTKYQGGPVDPVLTAIRERLERDTGKRVTEGQVLGLWRGCSIERARSSSASRSISPLRACLTSRPKRRRRSTRRARRSISAVPYVAPRTAKTFVLTDLDRWIGRLQPHDTPLLLVKIVDDFV